MKNRDTNRSLSMSLLTKNMLTMTQNKMKEHLPRRAQEDHMFKKIIVASTI